MGEILIGKPYVMEMGNKARLCSLITENSKTYEMWFEVDLEYKQYLCVERADAFILALLMYCLKNGSDIKSEGCISRQLYYQLTRVYIPTLGKHADGFNEFRIHGETTDEKLSNARGVGTGVSGGVDSFYTILKHYKLGNGMENYSLTHLTFFNAGSHGDFGGDEARELFHKRLALGRQIADELQLPLVVIDSNISEYIKMSFLPTASIRNLAMVMSVQKLFDKYYFSSGEPIHWFRIDATENDNYDLLNTYACSTENIIIHNTGMSETRMEKINFIAEFPVTYKYLNICIQDDYNCGECDKCVRTMNSLYALGKLERYKSVFDLEEYYKNFSISWGKTIEKASDATYSQQNHKEALDLMKQKEIPIPKEAYKYVKEQRRKRVKQRIKVGLKARIKRIVRGV